MCKAAEAAGVYTGREPQIGGNHPITVLNVIDHEGGVGENESYSEIDLLRSKVSLLKPRGSEHPNYNPIYWHIPRVCLPSC